MPKDTERLHFGTHNTKYYDTHNNTPIPLYVTKYSFVYKEKVFKLQDF